MRHMVCLELLVREFESKRSEFLQVDRRSHSPLHSTQADLTRKGKWAGKSWEYLAIAVNFKQEVIQHLLGNPAKFIAKKILRKT